MRTRATFVPLILLGVILSGLAGPPIEDIKVGQHSATIPVPREQEWWTARHERFNKLAAENDEERIDLVFLGDSITQSWEGNGREVWAKQYGERHAANFGISGDRTQHVLWRLDHGNIEGIAPKLIVLMIGTNNSGDNSPREIADGVILILKKLRERLPETKILTLAIFPRGVDENDARRKTNQAANAIIEQAADGEMIHFLDIGDVFLEDDGTLPKSIMPDLLHLNREGYERWAQAIEEQVKALMGEN